MSKGFSKGYELEQILLQRMEQRYADGECCPSVADFFESDSDKETHFSVLGDLGKRKARVVLPDGDGVLGVPGGGRQNGTAALCPPTANRGATFHTPIKEKDQSVFEQITQTVDGFKGQSCPRIMGGFDGGVEVGFDGNWNESSFRQLLKTLNDAKQEAQIPGNDKRFFSIQDNVFLMNPRSAGGGVTYNFVFEGRGIKFYVHSNPAVGIQPIRIRYGAEALIGQDLYAVHRQTREFLESLGFTVTAEKISRVDMQVMIERDISEFMQAIKERRVVCTARKYSLNGDGFEKSAQTFTLGKQIQVCIYDKRQELFDHIGSEPHKFVLMVLNCFGEQWLTNGTPCTRVEFRIKREVLKDMDINTMEDLQQYEQGLAHYCCHSWFRLLREQKVKGHSHEQEVDPVWQEVQNAFAQWFPGVVDGENKEVKRLYVKPLLCSAKQFIQQGIGCFAKSAALFMNGESNPKKILTFIIDTIYSHSVSLVQKAVDASVELGVRAGVVDPYDVETAFVPPDRDFMFDFRVRVT